MKTTPSPTDWLAKQRDKARTGTTSPPLDERVATDALTAKWLAQYHVSHAPVAQVPSNMIDEKASLTNQARPEPVVAESVERFALALKEGKYLGAIVAFPRGNKLVIVDGNNRYAAHRRVGSPFVPAIIISEDTPSELITLMTVSANTAHGVTPPLSWRVRQAAHLATIGFPDADAAVAAGIKPAELRAFRNLQRADSRAAAMRIAGFSALSPTTRTLLAAITSDPVFYQMARTVIDTAMPLDDLREALRSVRVERTEQGQLSAVARLAEERRLEQQHQKSVTALNGKRISSPKTGLVTALGKIMHVDPVALANQTVTELDRTEMVRRCNAAGEKLLEIIIAIDALKEQRDVG